MLPEAARLVVQCPCGWRGDRRTPRRISRFAPGKLVDRTLVLSRRWGRLVNLVNFMDGID
jgi:hypothetical protein